MSSLPKRRFRNPVVSLPPDYRLCYSDKASMRFSQSIFIRGSALAAVEAVFRAANPSEVFVYLTAPAEDPRVIDGILIPRQKISAAGCMVEPRDLIRAARKARREGKEIVGASHSHGASFAVCTSFTDSEQMRTFADEGVGWRWPIRRLRTGVVRESGEAAPGDSTGRVYEVEFPDQPDLCGRITSGSELDADDLRVEIFFEQYRTVSCFATGNGKGDEHLFPLLVRHTCHQCGGLAEREIKPHEIRVHVLGEVEITEEEEARIGALVAERAKRGYTGWGGNLKQSALGLPIRPGAPGRDVHRLPGGVHRVRAPGGARGGGREGPGTGGGPRVAGVRRRRRRRR